MTPSTAAVISHSARAAATSIDMTAMTAACAKLDHAAKAITLRCADVSRAASSKKTPSVKRARDRVEPLTRTRAVVIPNATI